jgi:chitinase
MVSTVSTWIGEMQVLCFWKVRLTNSREYPVAPERSGKPADLANYVSFLKNLKNALGSGGHKYGLTITIPSSFWYMQNFDIVAISKTIDWLNVMSYDLHGKYKSSRRMFQWRS